MLRWRCLLSLQTGAVSALVISATIQTDQSKPDGSVGSSRQPACELPLLYWAF
jgi:hypothetical protein